MSGNLLEGERKGRSGSENEQHVQRYVSYLCLTYTTPSNPAAV